MKTYRIPALEKNEFMIPEQMRSNKSPIMVRVLMGKKHSSSEVIVELARRMQNCPYSYKIFIVQISDGSGQYNASDYGDDWGEETTIIRKVDDVSFVVIFQKCVSSLKK